MTPDQLELLRKAILNVLDANDTAIGLRLTGIAHNLAMFGFHGTPSADLKREVQYLTDKRLVEPVKKVVSPENRAWRITAEGRDYLASNE